MMFFLLLIFTKSKQELNLDTLIACRNHWYVMEMTGSSYKHDYKPSFWWSNACACCEYVKGEYGLKVLQTIASCKACPLAGYAWETCCIFSGQSFYEDWGKARTLEQRQFCAGRMVYACNQAIENYLLNKEN